MIQKIDLKTRKILHKVHLNRIKNRKGLNRVSNYISTKTLKVKKYFFKGKICGEFGAGSHGGGGLNVLKLGAGFVHLLDVNKNIKVGIDKNLKKFAIMIALTFKKNIIQSWIYKPLTEDLMYATNKKGTYINGHKVFKIKNKKIVNSTGSISFKYWNKKDQNTIYILKNNFKKINSYGSIGCEYFDIVLGKRDFTILSKLSPWDHIPGVLLVRESGGADCHFDKKRYKFNKKCKNLIVSNSKTLNLEIIKKIEEINHDYK